MGGVSSKDASPEAFATFKKCRERYEAQLKRTMKELDKIRDDYTRRGKRPFDVQESQEITLILNKIGNRTFLCSLGGGIFSYAAARYFTRYNTGFRRAFLRTSATLTGFMLGSTYGAFTALSMYSAEFLEKSRWSPRLICPAVSQYKPCIEHSGCRELMTKDGWARVLLDCYSVCERRRKELTLTGRALEEGLGEEEGAGGFEEVGFAAPIDDDSDFQEPDFTSEEEMAGDNGKGDSQSGGQGKKGKSGW